MRAFLAARRAEARFGIGDWLATLTPEMLDELHDLAEFATSNESRYDGVNVQIKDLCETALTAESYPGRAPKTPKEIANSIRHLQTLISIVAVSRVGYIKITKTLALSSQAKRKFVVTDAGRQMGIRVGPLGI
ncbi:hypothetical protein AYR66_19735 [Noviherbaspirillum denitrificans]|uniref:Uncharacterized protein n=1 Tax=Noviherbaspirillum denitrificans TaxID=1968433 RepID=A0A254TFH0_9BURK|nr:hypothetical protein AYR66_19735 [Noviherbaspirillum denitrificans]